MEISKIKTVVIAAVVALIIITVETKSTPAISTITVETNQFLITDRKEKLPISHLNFVKSRLDKHKLSSCQIEADSLFINWIELIGKLIIIGSFSSVGVIGNSVLIERYVKLIFKDILPIFLIAFLLLSLLSIASITTAIAFSSSAPLSASLSSQGGCISK